MRLRAPTVLGLSPGLPFTLYWWRLRRRAAQEALAVAGIAVGVALVFGVLVANTSIVGSVKTLMRQFAGSAQVQLIARSQQGFPQSVAERVQTLPGVQAVSPLLRVNVEISGSHGSEPVQLIGATVKQLSLNPSFAHGLGPGAESLISGGLGLPEKIAAAIGVRPEQLVTVRTDGTTKHVYVRAILGSQTVGAVAASPIAIGQLYFAQLLTGQPGRVSDVLVRAAPSALASVTRQLKRIAAGRIDVVPADNELTLFDTAAKPNQQSTTLFAAIAGMVGFLLALNAMLLTMPERRRFVAELRTFGYDPAQIVLVLATQALILGLAGSIAGIALGDLFARTLFGEVPSYLTAAFPIGGQRTVTASTILIALACGLAAALLASARPLLDLRNSRPVDAALHEQGETGQGLPARTIRVSAALAVGLVLAATILSLIAASLTIVGGVLLALASMCAIPLVYAAAVRLLKPIGERSKGILPIATVEIESTATRSIALAAIASLAVYGSLAIGGARADLKRGIEEAIAQYERTADVWVTTGPNVFNTDSFGMGDLQRRIERAPGVAAVRVYQGGLLDVGTRRIWVRARSPSGPALLEPSQVVQGNYDVATRLMRAGEWAAVSGAFADEHDLEVGDPFALPTPTGSTPLRVAAIMTNSGWPAGSVTLTTADYQRGWATTDPSAFEVELAPGVSAGAGAEAVRAALGPGSGLTVQTAGEREAQTDASVGQGLRSLSEISTMLLITGALAVAASLIAVVWQRRARLAAMKTWGYDHLQLWRSMLLESFVLLAVGCADGALLGLYGHALADRWLRATTGFPAPFAVGGPQMILTLALLVGIAMAVLAVPGLSAARVSPILSFQE